MATQRRVLTWLLEAVLGVVFILVSVVALVCVLVGQFPLVFWVAAATALLIAAISRQRLAFVAATVLFLTSRLAIAALATRRIELMVAIGASVVVFSGVWRWHLGRELRNPQALVAGRRCPRCGEDMTTAKLWRAEMDDRDDGRLRILGRCVCGEYTLFDETGATRHVGPPLQNDAV